MSAGRFLVFAGDIYYPAGGWMDFQGAFDAKTDAMLRAAGRLAESGLNWAHVVDTEAGRIVWKDGRHLENEP